MTLYGPRNFGTVMRGAAAAQCAGVVGPFGPVARAVRERVWPRGAAWRVSPLSARSAERQPTQVDERHARAHQRPRCVSSLSALHHRRPVGRCANLAAAAPRDSRTHRRADSRRDQFSQTGDAFGRRRSPVLRHVGQGRQLPGGRHGGVVDGRAGVDARRRAVSAGGVAYPDARQRAKFRRRCGFKRSGGWRSHCCAKSVRPGSTSPRCSAMPNSATTPRCVGRCTG